VAITTAGGFCTTINNLRQSQHASIWWLRPDSSCDCNAQPPGALEVEQMAIYECKRLEDSKLCNATCFESISWNPTLADNLDVLEHRYAAKQHLVPSIRGAHKGDLDRGMLKQRPSLDITCSIQYQGWAQVGKFISHFIQSGRDKIVEHYHLHRFESDEEWLEFINFILADTKYHFPVAERVEGGVPSPNTTQREWKDAKE